MFAQLLNTDILRVCNATNFWCKILPESAVVC